MAKPRFSQKDANFACRTPYCLLEQRIIQRLVPPDRSGTVDSAAPLFCDETRPTRSLLQLKNWPRPAVALNCAVFVLIIEIEKAALAVNAVRKKLRPQRWGP